MLYPSGIEQKLGFDKVKSAIRNKCRGEFGQDYVDNIKFSANYELVHKLLNQTAEFVQIIQSGEGYPRNEYFNISQLLTKASKIDAHLTEEDFHELKLTLTKTEELLMFFQKNKEKYLHLSLLTIGVYLNPQILFRINQVIDEKGKMRSSASDELLKIRNKLQEIEFKVRNKLERILKKFIKDGYSTEEVNITIRNGRLVIPVRAEFKRVVGGFIHDESASGQTAFIEPAALVEMNNDIRDLTHQEKREILRILMALTDMIRPEIDNLRKCYEFVGRMDFIEAKASYALDLEAVLPELRPAPVIDWIQARHPLLYLSHQRSGKPVIPLNIRVTDKQRILIISGPNAGGKSVCLQTVGLIQYMLQSGLLVPVQDNSVAGIFPRLFIDIGDEQSLENDLSTYSSHLMNMHYFLEHANRKTLFLIDEFGTGTEPQFGGAIAEAILERLTMKKAYGIITTHYTNLKKYAERTEGVVNGAMRFDIGRMEPMFQLQIGKPGSSFALEIAGKIGLPDDIIQNAKKGIGTSHVNFERLLSELEQEKKDFERQKQELLTRERELDKITRDYESLNNYLEENKKKILDNSRREADDLISRANREIEKTIRGIKEAKADKERTRILRKNLEKFKEDLQLTEKTQTPDAAGDIPVTIIPGEISKGDFVRIKGQATAGQVIRLKGDTAEVAIGDLKSKLAISRLEKISASNFKEITGARQIPSSRYLMEDIGEKYRNFTGTLDLRGRRADEALALLNKYLDEALLLGYRELRILHGKGDGILREVIRKHLRDFDYVKNVLDENVERGGAGISIVILK